MRPPPFTTRCRYACNRICGHASSYMNRFFQCSECRRKKSWNASISLSTFNPPSASTYHVVPRSSVSCKTQPSSRGTTSA